MDIELQRPAPQYTITTLRALEKAYSKHHFTLIVGADTLEALPTWKEGLHILERYPVAVYRRSEAAFPNYPKAKHLKGPPYHVSSTEVRHRIQHQQNIANLLPEAVRRCIEKKKLYATDPPC